MKGKLNQKNILPLIIKQITIDKITNKVHRQKII